MSTFVLKREYALQLPTSFVDIDRDEMEYVDGGAYYKEYWWGWALDLSSSECNTMCDLLDYNLYAGGGTAALAVGISGAFPLVGAAGAVAAGLYAMNVGMAKTKLKAAYNTGRGATLCKKITGYSVNIW